MLIVNHSSMELEKENSHSFHAAALSTPTASLRASDSLASSWVWALKWTRTTWVSSNHHHPYPISILSPPTSTSQQGALWIPSHLLCIYLASSLPGGKSRNLKAQTMRFHKDKQTTCATLVLLEQGEEQESPSQVHPSPICAPGLWKVSVFAPILRVFFPERLLLALLSLHPLCWEEEGSYHVTHLLGLGDSQSEAENWGKLSPRAATRPSFLFHTGKDHPSIKLPLRSRA